MRLLLAQCVLLMLGFSCLMVYSGCHLKYHDENQTIRVGDSVASARAKLDRWGSRAIPLAWSYGIDLSETPDQAKARFQKEKNENDFHDSPSFSLLSGSHSKTVFFRARNGVLVEITRISGENFRNWEPGFSAVTKDGRFIR